MEINKDCFFLSHSHVHVILFGKIVGQNEEC